MTDFNQKPHDTDVGSHGGKSRQMMEVFENQEFGSIRVLQEAGKTFFCASDVAKALGYVNPYEAHRDTLALRNAAKKAFDAYKKENGSDKKLPRISELNAEYAEILPRKKKNYQSYRAVRKENEEWKIAKSLVAAILQEETHQEEEQRRQQNQEKSH